MTGKKTDLDNSSASSPPPTPVDSNVGTFDNSAISSNNISSGEASGDNGTSNSSSDGANIVSDSPASSILPVNSSQSVAVDQQTIKYFKVTMTGAVKGENSFPEGTKMNVVYKSFSDSYIKFNFTNESGKPVGATAALNDNITINATQKASGG